MAGQLEEKSLDHAMKHFEIHAAQRLTAFNFFIVISGAILAAIAASLQKPQEFGLMGAILGLLLILLSGLFYKLDQRTKFLIKHSESSIKKFEAKFLPDDFRVFSNEEEETDKDQASKNCIKKMFSYSRVFFLMFAGSALLGFGGLALSVSQSFGLIDLSIKDQTGGKKDIKPELEYVAITASRSTNSLLNV